MSNSITRVKVWEGNYLIFQKFLSVFWIIIFLGSRDFLGFGHVIGYPDGIQLLINRLSLSNIAIILFSFLLFKRYKNYYTIDSFGRSFIFVSSIVFILIIINPNNNFTSLKQAILGYDQKCFYTYIVFFSSIYFLPPKFIYIVVKSLFVSGIKIGFSILVIALWYYLFDKGLMLFGHKSTIVHADILQTLSIFAIILMFLFYTEKKKRNLLYVSIIMLTVFLSFRRSAFWFFVITAIIITYYLLLNRLVLKRTLGYVVIVGASSVLLIGIFNSESFDLNYYFQRQLAAFAFFTNDKFGSKNIYLTDSNHIFSSIESSKFIYHSIFNNFWGNGINISFMDSSNNVFGASRGGTHNSFAFVVIRYGVFMLIYYIFIIHKLLAVLISNRKLVKLTMPVEVLYSYLGIMILLLNILSTWSPTMVTFIFADANSIVQFVCLFPLIKIVENYGKSKNIYSVSRLATTSSN
jgi:hypothetical protein